MVTGVWQIEKKNWLLKATFWVWVKKKVSNLFFILMSLKVLWCGQKGSICPFFNWYLRPFFYKTKKWEGNGKSQRCNGDGRWLMENLAMRNSFSKLWRVKQLRVLWTSFLWNIFPWATLKEKTHTRNSTSHQPPSGNGGESRGLYMKDWTCTLEELLTTKTLVSFLSSLFHRGPWLTWRPNWINGIAEPCSCFLNMRRNQVRFNQFAPTKKYTVAVFRLTQGDFSQDKEIILDLTWAEISQWIWAFFSV